VADNEQGSVVERISGQRGSGWCEWG